MERAGLAHTWVFWLDEWHTAGTEVTQVATKMCSVSTPREFWSQMDKLPSTQVPAMSSLHIFREGVSPTWEDAANAHGGHFRIRDLTCQDMAHHWVQVAMALVGGHYTHSDKITGVTFSNKKNFAMVSLWLTTSAHETLLAVRDDVVKILSPRDIQIVWCVHKVSSQRGSNGPRQDIHINATHRRTKSAPDQNAPSGAGTSQSSTPLDSDDERDAGVDMSVSSPSPVSTPGSKGKGKPQQLNPDLFPVGSLERTSSSQFSNHHRSKSEGMCKEVIPKPSLSAPRLEAGGQTPPISPKKDPIIPASTSPTTLGKEMRQSREDYIRASNESAKSTDSWSKGWPIRPSPMKGVWADVPWSPSCLDAAVVPTPKQIFPQQIIPSSYSPQPAPQQPYQQQPYTNAPTRDFFGQHTNNNVAPISQTVQHQQQTQPQPHRSAAQQKVTTAPSPQPPRGGPALSQEEEDRRHPQATAFVFQGWLYPAKLNRKERRRIMFTAEVIPQEYEGAVFVGSEVPDGNVDETTEKQLRVKKVAPPSCKQEDIERRKLEVEHMKTQKKEEAEKIPPSTPPPSDVQPMKAAASSHGKRGHQRSVAFSEPFK
eukprot:PhF_6_TR26280/c0_g1_i1/m.37648